MRIFARCRVIAFNTYRCFHKKTAVKNYFCIGIVNIISAKRADAIVDVGASLIRSKKAEIEISAQGKTAANKKCRFGIEPESECTTFIQVQRKLCYICSHHHITLLYLCRCGEEKRGYRQYCQR